jgi:bifunctional non-homologous end joining protein LigD
MAGGRSSTSKRARSRCGRRRGRAITEQVPELAGLAEHLGRPCVLDGELVAGAGRPWDFYRVAPRLARRGDRLANARRLTFVAFDVLWLDEALTIALPYAERRPLLEGLALAGPAWATVGSFDEPATRCWKRAPRSGSKGLVAERTDSPYRPSVRSEDWVKVKTASRGGSTLGGSATTQCIHWGDYECHLTQTQPRATGRTMPPNGHC